MADNKAPDRDRFGSRLAFYFAAVGSAVGFGNVWRFPALAYEYGGGAFFIPYILALLLIGIPVLFLEIALGQYYQRGDVSVFASFHKRMRGVGLTSVLCGYIVLTYYSMLISWVLRCLFESGRDEAPWKNDVLNSTETSGYFFNTIVGMETLGDDSDSPTRIVGANVGYSCLSFILIFLCSAFGLKFTGAITYITMGLPIIFLFLFFIRGLTLEGSADGVKAYIGEWDVKVLSERGDSWSTAVSQIFFSLSVCFGIMTAYGSHMPRDEPAFFNSCVIAVSNCMFSFIAGFAVFAAVGHLAHLEGKEVSELEGLGGFSLVFGTWPVVLGSLPGGIHWIRLLFLNLFLLGIDSAFSFLEGVVTCVHDTKGFEHTPKWMICLVFCITGFILSLLYATDAGLNFLDAVDFYINFLFLLVGFFETFGLGWIYNFEEQISEFGEKTYVTYMATTFGSVLFACIFWFALENHAIWAGFVALILSYGAGMCITVVFLNGHGGEGSLPSRLSRLAFGNMQDFKKKVEPTIGMVPTVWCVLIKHFVPHVLLILFINLAVSTDTETGKPTFGTYGGYSTMYQVIGICMFGLAVTIFLVGAILPDLYERLDTHDGVLGMDEVKDSDKKFEGDVVDAEDPLKATQ